MVEGYFTMPQVARALREGRVFEMFGTGTAATIAPIGEILYKGAILIMFSRGVVDALRAAPH